MALRKQNRLSQAAVAREMGVGQSVVAEIESGKIDVRFTTLDRYVSAVSQQQARLAIEPLPARVTPERDPCPARKSGRPSRDPRASRMATAR